MAKQMKINMDDAIPFPFSLTEFAGISHDIKIAPRNRPVTAAEKIPEYALSRQVTVPEEHGIHARPAAKIASIAQKAKSDVWIINGDQEADAKSMICILTLGCGKGTRIVVKIDDMSDFDVLNNIVKVVENGCGE